MGTMDRREFMMVVPAVTAGGLAGEAAASEESASDVGALQELVAAAAGFRLIGSTSGRVTSESGERFPFHKFLVECPYPVDSRAWVAVADHDGTGRVAVYDERDPRYVYVRTEKVRHVVLPRFSREAPIRNDGDLLRRARDMYQAVCEHGFDDARGPDHEWRVVSVEYRCTDGVEHILCGLPLSWDPRLALGVRVRGQIG